MFNPLTVNNISQPLGTQEILEPCHLLLQLPHQLGVGILIDDSIAFNLLCTISISAARENNETLPQTWNCLHTIDMQHRTAAAQQIFHLQLYVRRVGNKSLLPL